MGTEEARSNQLRTAAINAMTPTLRRHVTARNLWTAVTRPSYALRRIRKTWYEYRHPRDPWIAPEAVSLIDKYLRPSHSVVEWGSGRSTLWFAQRVHTVLSVEHQPDWASTVDASLRHAGFADRVTLRTVPLGAADSHDYVAAVDVVTPRSVDLALIDGLWRADCVARAVQLLRPAGLLVVDNSDRMHVDQWPVPSEWHMILHANFFGERTTIWQAPDDL